MSSEGIDQDIESGNFKPVYVLTGSELLLRREALTALSHAVLAGSPKEFNETRVTFKESSAEVIADACRTFPMMGRRRLVVVSGIDALKAKESEALARYFEDPCDTAVLVLVAETVDLKLKVWKAAQKVGRIEKFEPPYQEKLPAWIEHRAKKKKMKIARDAAAFLGEVIGADLAGLDEALERLYLFCADPNAKGTPPEIALADVEKCIARTRTHTINDLMTAMGRRDAKSAIRVLESMLETKEPPIRILSMIGFRLRKLWEALERQERGENRDAIGRAISTHAYFLDDVLKQSRMFGHREYAELLDRVFETDRLLKSSRLEPDIHLFGLVLEACSPRR